MVDECIKVEAIDHWSCVRNGGDKILKYFLKKSMPIECAVEIGTCRGLSADIIARYAEKVITIDKVQFEIIKRRSNVEYLIFENDDEKVDFLKGIEFDFAFIDGDHRKNGVGIDFNAVKKCKNILFHDYYINDEKPSINGCKSIVDSLIKNKEWEVELKDIFAYCRRK